MAKKRIYIPKTETPTPVEEPWIVVGGPGSAREGRPIYLQTDIGITRERAEELASRIQNARAVPAR